MENAAKALGIAAGVILAVILMSLIAYFFSTISEWPQQEEETASAEQLSKFNLEYEVYEKSAMYGVDVISCLNKAISNNETYMEGKGLLTGSRTSDEYKINVYVNIKSPLEETMEIYYFDMNSHTEKQRMDQSNTSQSSKEWKDLQSSEATYKKLSLEEIQENPSNKYYTAFTIDDPLYTSTRQLNKEKTGFDYYLEANGGTKKIILSDGTEKNYYSIEDTQLKNLLKFSAKNPKITIKNSEASDYRYWSTAIWITGLYDFKTKRFKCDEIKYSEVTGRINEIYFSEI